MAENYFGITDTGKQRSNNEDAYIAQPTSDGKYIIAAAIDGVGGYSGGEVAAGIARVTLIEQLDGKLTNIEKAIDEAFLVANDNIFQERVADKKLESMACVCTLVVADVENNHLYYGHIGDTRLYLFRDGSLVKLTNDHSFVGFLEDSGRLTEEAAMGHPKRNEINKALGFESNVRDQQNYVETGTSPFLPGDLLLLCSDGLTDMVNKHDLTEILAAPNSLKEKAKNLVNLANHNGGHDNITAVLVKNDKSPARQNAVMPAAIEPKSKPSSEPEPENSRTVEEEEPVIDNQVVKTSNNKGLVAILTLFCLLFLGSTVWLYLKGKPALQQASATPKDTTASKTLSANQQKLVSQIASLKGDTLNLSDTAYKTPIAIDSTISITKDTLYIKGKGNIVFKADSAFKGPAFHLSDKNKVVVFYHVSFDGFETAIGSYNNNLVLRGVKFSNCKIPVQVSFSTPQGKSITGWLPSTVFKTDTTSTTSKK